MLNFPSLLLILPLLLSPLRFGSAFKISFDLLPRPIMPPFPDFTNATLFPTFASLPLATDDVPVNTP
jgi:hypothetical protein